MSEDIPRHLRPVPDATAVEGALAQQRADEDWNGIVAPSRRGGTGGFLTDVIVALGFVPRDRVEEAIETARNTGTTPEQVLLAAGLLKNEQLARALAERYGFDYLDLTMFKVDSTAANLVSTGSAKRYHAVPVSFVDERTLLVAMADPANVLAVDDIAIMTGYEVRPAVASADDIAALVQRLARIDDVVADVGADAEEEDVADIIGLRESADDAPIVKLVHQVVAQAIELGASDVHLAPGGRELRVRFRVDGVLSDQTTIPRRMVSGVISRVKIMAELDIAERRVPQDGRFGLTIDGHHVDLRVVTLPSVNGESVVIRILDKEAVAMNLGRLGMGEDDYRRFQRAFRQAYGAVLVTGPTGSGKSTTLYAALTEINTREKNILTIEDPVEYELDGVTQMQINPKAGLTFANGLRSMMRADPDIVMVGEIRDRETAQIAVESALTGHLVLSTLHTNDAPTAITRLIEMGIEPFLVASALDCVVAQRLARLLCSDCKRRTILSSEVLRDNGFAIGVDIEAYEAVGCRRCNGSGYRGRAGLYEVMDITDEIRSLAIERRSADEIRDVALRQGMRRLQDDGLEKVRLGRISITEVARVVGTRP
jgi:type IV pilus assembly protein PilB